MDHTTSTQPDSAHPDHPQDPGRRDFIYIAAATVGAVGVGLVAWPFIDQMNPDEAQLALATTEIDISAIVPGMSVTVMWQGKPVFIRHRTEEEIAAARAVPLTDLKDQVARNANLPADAIATDENRAAGGHEAFLIMIGICTHLGCVPVGQSGDFGGWFCPCHGSHYDTAGRIRVGPAPFNLDVPVVNFLDDATIRIG